MRCKNCGCENDDNLYICQNCGSPLYEEGEGPITDDEQSEQNAANQTQVFSINSPGGEYQNYSQNAQNQGAYQQNYQSGGMPTPDDEEEQEKKKKQQTIIIIAVLVVILIAVIIGTVVAVAHKNNSNKPSESSSYSSSQVTSSSTTRDYSSTARITTESTTETTSAPTESTTTTTAPVTYTVSVSVDGEGGGSVSGGGSYKSGKRVTVIAAPDDGYEFKGWYSGDSLMSTSKAYSFQASQNIDLTARFAPSQTDENIPNADGGTD